MRISSSPSANSTADATPYSEPLQDARYLCGRHVGAEHSLGALTLHNLELQLRWERLAVAEQSNKVTIRGAHANVVREGRSSTPLL